MREKTDRVIALCGNPNVGKSTVFNALTGLRQHTGNWPGKTVAGAWGLLRGGEGRFAVVDTPGTYSLAAHSPEEEIARDFICFGEADLTVVVCDGTCPERGIKLALETLEITGAVVLCVNLMDEARRKHVETDLKLIASRLGIPVVSSRALQGKSLKPLVRVIEETNPTCAAPRRIPYPAAVEDAIAALEPALRDICGNRLPPRWVALQMLLGDEDFLSRIEAYLGGHPFAAAPVAAAWAEAEAILSAGGLTEKSLREAVVSSVLREVDQVVEGAVFSCKKSDALDRRLDRVLLSPWSGYPLLFLLLLGIFWLTLKGASYPSAWLSGLFAALESLLRDACRFVGLPPLLVSFFFDGVYRVLSGVVAVMLPPMAIFFPLFTLLEDVGYLPRMACNLDRPFQCCHACGKQGLTMCMGFGCNAVGVTGCRIIDSPRERLLGILTNTLVPCNGRFPILLTVISLFFASSAGSGFTEALLFTLVIFFAVGMTFLATFILSRTVLKGTPSSFVLELPPYRRPAILRILYRSLLDRTLFVLGRAAAVAAPAGAVLWILTTVEVGGVSLLGTVSSFLEPVGWLMGLDGIILCAFLLGFPAAEIVLPIALMAYSASDELVLGSVDIAGVGMILMENGWTVMTAVSVLLFTLLHWPCSTTLMTVYKETKSVRWTALAALFPTGMGVVLCTLSAALFRLFA